MTAPSSFKRFKSRLAWDEIDRESVKSLLHLCLIEEKGRENADSCLGDVTTDSCKITGLGKASLVAREPMILCGIGLIPLIANAFGVPQVKLARQVDKQQAQTGEIIGQQEQSEDAAHVSTLASLDGADGVVRRDNRNFKFVFKRKIYLKNQDGPSEDGIFNHLMFLQSTDEVIFGNIPIQDENEVVTLITKNETSQQVIEEILFNKFIAGNPGE